MTRFTDGPAKGQTLMLRRAPVFLRVTELNGKFDALDQMEDTPMPNERLHCYRIFGKPIACHIRAGRGASGFYTIAEYRAVENPPTDEEMRDAIKWAQWVDRRRRSWKTASLQ